MNRILPVGLLVLVLLNPVFTNLSTAIGLLLSLVVIFTGRFRGVQNSSVKYLAFFCWGYFAILIFSNFVNDPRLEAMEHLGSSLQFLYLPFLFLAISSLDSDWQSFDYSRLFFTLIAIVSVLMMLEAMFLPEPILLKFQSESWDILDLNIRLGFPDRVTLLANNPLTLGDLVMPLAFLSLLGFWKLPVRMKVMRCIAWLVLIASLVLLAKNRSSVLLIISLGGILCVYLVATYSGVYSKTRILVGFVGLCLIAIAVFITAPHNLAKQRLISAGKAVYEISSFEADLAQISDRSVRIRLDMYQAALGAIQENPLIGYGPEKQFSAIKPYLKTKDARDYTNKKDRNAHNLLLNHLLAGGVPLLMLILAIVLSPFVIIWKNRSKLGSDLIFAGTILSTSIFVSGLTNNVFFDDGKNTGYLTMLFMFAIIASHKLKTLTD